LPKPKSKLPFAVPKGSGAVVIATANAKPRFFREHFTGTDSWILTGTNVSIGQAGTYHVVTFGPKNQAGKLWVSIGTREVFTLNDWKQFPRWRRLVRRFHEVGTEAKTAPALQGDRGKAPAGDPASAPKDKPATPPSTRAR
jgi:hypothetical protein